jgi:hypothetical protein
MTTTISDVLIIAATFLGPIIAVQLTRWLDNGKERRDRKFQIFNILMATRAYNVSYGHVEALNRIDVEFSGNKDKDVIDAWKAYHDHLSNRNLSIDVWIEKRITLFSELLYKMSQNLGYNFDKTYIKNMSYSPERHEIIENDQEKLRTAVLSLLQHGSIPISITNFPTVQNNQPQQDQIKKSL